MLLKTTTQITNNDVHSHDLHFKWPVYFFLIGQDYGHQTPNPSNQCQWCNLYDPTARANSAWSNRPGACDDQDTCTKQDKCNAGRYVYYYLSVGTHKSKYIVFSILVQITELISGYN